MNAEEAVLWYKNKGSPVRDNRLPEVYYTTGLSE